MSTLSVNVSVNGKHHIPTEFRKIPKSQFAGILRTARFTPHKNKLSAPRKTVPAYSALRSSHLEIHASTSQHSSSRNVDGVRVAVQNFLMDMTAGNAAGNRGGANYTGTVLFILLPAVLRRSLLPGSSHRDGWHTCSGTPDRRRRPWC